MTKDDRKALIVLKALLLGLEVECKEATQGGIYRLDEEHNLCMKATRLDTATGEESEAWLKVCMGAFTLADFIGFARRFTDEEIAGAVAEIVLTGGAEPYREPMASQYAPQHNLKHILGEEGQGNEQ